MNKKTTLVEKPPPKTVPESNKTYAENKELEQKDEEYEDPTIETGQDEALIIDSLVSMPLPEDTLLFAMATCAPYSSMQKYKFKVTLKFIMNIVISKYRSRILSFKRF